MYRWKPGEVFWQNIGAYYANPSANALALIEVWIALAKNVLLQNLPTTGQNQLNRVLFNRGRFGIRGDDMLQAHAMKQSADGSFVPLIEQVS